MNTIISAQNHQTKYSIAWFKLYESVIKNEHERAFLNYKLLVHSYEDKGFHKQIQGELHLLFNEIDLAIKAFIEAFIIYFNTEDYLASIMIYLKIRQYQEIKLNELNSLKEIIKNNKKRYLLYTNEIL